METHGEKENRTSKISKGRVSTQVHTRKLDRSVAHARMKKADMRHVNKHAGIKGGRIDSYFSSHWREVANTSMNNM